MGISLDKQEKQQVLSTLTYATHKMIKQLEVGKMVGNLDFYHFCEDHFKGGVWLGFITKLNYYHHDYSKLYVKIKCKYLGTKFKVTFSMKEIMQNDRSKKWQAYSIDISEKVEL